KSINDEVMRDAHIFSWRTPTGTDAIFNSYGAVCNIAELAGGAGSATSGHIEINWSTAEADRVVVYYRENRGGNNPVYEGSAANSTAVNAQDRRITVSKPNDNNVRQGYAVTGINEYEIFIELYKDSIRINFASFKIWNVPGMNVTQTNTASVSSQSELTDAIADESKTNIVLINSFSVEDWISPNLTNRNFYGNGHTITINSLTAETDMGLFGIVNGGVVRDLTVEYYAPAPVLNNIISITGPASASRFGGLAGTATGAARIENVLVTGAVSFNVNGDNTAFAGGLTGLLTNTGTAARTIISNVYGSLNLTVNKATGTNSSLYAGGVTGSMGEPTPTDGGRAVTVQEATVVGDIDITATATATATNATRYTQGLFVGGLAGFVNGAAGATNQATLTDSSYQHGTIRIVSDAGNTYLGGAIGNARSNAAISNCSALQTAFDIIRNGSGTDFVIGGFIGTFRGGTMRYCFAEGDVVISSPSEVFTYAGGFAGDIGANVSYCYAKGNVSITGNGASYAGGFVGHQYINNTISNCFATGNVNAVSLGTSATQSDARAGGFASAINGSISDCYATGDVFAEKRNTGGTAMAGAFVAYFEQPNLNRVNRCFAAGNALTQRSVGSNSIAGGFFAASESYQAHNSGNTVIQNSAALGLSVTATGGTSRSIGRFFGNYNNQSPVANNYAFNGMRLYNSAFYDDGRPNEIVVAPLEMTGNVTLSGTVESATITINNFDVTRTAGTTLDSINVTASGVINRSFSLDGTEDTRTISDINLSNLTNIGNQHILLNITLNDNAGNSKVYHIRIRTRVARTVSDTDFTVFEASPRPYSPQAIGVGFGTIRNRSFWQDTLGFSSSNWDFTNVPIQGHPRLRSADGGVLGGQ
ncbi:MAG: hypothetical protein FWD26_06290, partial [Treponema sp.]|nr:hypothetical protein [Treponema sp.]